MNPLEERRKFVRLLTGGILLFSLGCEQGDFKVDSSQTPPVGPRVGFQAPDFSVATLDGQNLSLSDYRGKVVMLNFWATWCIPCRTEMPSMERLYARYGGSSFEILAISGGEDESAVRPFVDDFKLNFPIALDSPMDIYNAYKVTAIPSTYLVNRDGVITHRFFGAVEWDEEEYRQLVAKLIRTQL